MTSIELAKLDHVLVALTIQDRQNKKKPMAKKWPGIGFSKIKKPQLKQYWQKRIEQNAEDYAFFKRILAGFERTNYHNMTTGNTKIKVNLPEVSEADLPKVLFSNYIETSAQKLNDNFLKSLENTFKNLLDLSEESIDVEITIKARDEDSRKELKQVIKEKIEKDVSAKSRKHIEVIDSSDPIGQTPSIWNMAKSAAKAGGKFLRSGMQTVSPQEFENRMTICRGCEFWNPKGFAGSGQCLKCGCSTQAKLRMATESCPIKKWVATVS